MSNFTDFFPAAGGGGGGIPKYQDFTSSGTFTPTQALIDAGGRVAYFIVGGGERGEIGVYGHGGAGGQVKMGYATLTSTTGCAVTIGSGGSGSNNAAGGASSIAFNSAGGTAVTANGGDGNALSSNNSSPGGHGHYWNAYMSASTSAGSGVLGYGIGGSAYSDVTFHGSGIETGGANTGHGSRGGENAGSGFVRITWFE